MSLDHQNTEPRDLAHTRSRISDEIQKSARLLRFSSSKRRAVHKLVGLRPRVQDQIFKLTFVASILLLLFVPILCSVIYYLFIATDRYSSEARFVVRPGEYAVSASTSDISGGTPSAKIVQDTLVVKNYLTSIGLIHDLSEKLDLLTFFSKDDVDRFSRLEQDALMEDILSYWNSMLDVEVSQTSGIVSVELQAFSAEEAQFLLTEALKLAELRLNKLNESLWSELKSSSALEYENARIALETARLDYRIAQIEAGVFDVDKYASNLEQLIKDEQSELLAIQSERRLLSEYMVEDAPKMKILKMREEIKLKQINGLRARLAGDNSDRANLSDYNANFTQAELERKIAETRFKNAVEDLERVNIMSSLQLVYMHAFLSPTLAEKPSQPRRLLMIGLLILASVVAFGVTIGVSYLIYRQID